MSVSSLRGARFFVTFKDDAPGFHLVYFLRHKSDVPAVFRRYAKLVENKFGRSIKTVRSDNGREYVNKQLEEYLVSRGIRLETTVPYTPQQNGRSELDNRTIVESARTMLQAANLPLTLWAEAVSTAVYLLNRTPSSSVQEGKTPYEVWFEKKANLDHVRIFGSEAFVHIPKQFTTKFDARAKKVILVGYDGESSKYRVYDPNTKRVSVSRDVILNEKSIGTKNFEHPDEWDEAFLPMTAIEDKEEKGFEKPDGVAGVQPVIQQAAEASTGPQQAVRTPTLRNRATLKVPVQYQVNLAEYLIPTTFKEAVSGLDAGKWREAIDDEMESHQRNQTWSITPRTTQQKVIHSKWVFKMMTAEFLNDFWHVYVPEGFFSEKGWSTMKHFHQSSDMTRFKLC